MTTNSRRPLFAAAIPGLFVLPGLLRPVPIRDVEIPVATAPRKTRVFLDKSPPNTRQRRRAAERAAAKANHSKRSST